MMLDHYVLSQRCFQFPDFGWMLREGRGDFYVTAAERYIYTIILLFSFSENELYYCAVYNLIEIYKNGCYLLNLQFLLQSKTSKSENKKNDNIEKKLNFTWNNKNIDLTHFDYKTFIIIQTINKLLEFEFDLI